MPCADYDTLAGKRPQPFLNAQPDNKCRDDSMKDKHIPINKPSGRREETNKLGRLSGTPYSEATRRAKPRWRARHTDITFTISLLCPSTHLKKKSMPPNGLRYRLVGGTR